MLTLLRRLPWPQLGRAGRYLPTVILVLLAGGGVLAGILVKPWAPTKMLGLGRFSGIAVWLLLLLVARALARGKRQAWLLSVGLLVLLGAFSYGSRSMRFLFPMMLAVLLAFIVLAPLFRTRSDPGALARGYAALVAGCAAIYGHRIIYKLLSSVIPHPYSLMFTLRVAAFIFLGIGVIEIMRPVLPRRATREAELARARSLIERYGRHSLAHYTLGPNLSYFWGDTGQAFLCYRVHRGVAVMLGDPIGRDDELPALVRRFRQYCDHQDWELAIYQASPMTVELLSSGGVHAIKVGEEAIIDTSHFTVRGKIGAPVRHAVARARRDQVSVSIWHGEPLPEAHFAGMKQVSAAWLQAHRTYTQMGFSMGRFPADWSPELLTAVAQGSGGETLAFLTWTPLYRGNGWTLDNMRRGAQTPPGTVEYLIAESIEWARVRGYSTMSLSLAPLAGLGEEVKSISEAVALPRWRISSSARLFQRSAAYLHRRGLLLANYRSLYFFKQKFQPTWAPRYLVLDDAAALPRVLVALAVVHGMDWRSAARDFWASLHASRDLASRGAA